MNIPSHSRHVALRVICLFGLLLFAFLTSLDLANCCHSSMMASAAYDSVLGWPGEAPISAELTIIGFMRLNDWSKADISATSMQACRLKADELEEWNWPWAVSLFHPHQGSAIRDCLERTSCSDICSLRSMYNGQMLPCLVSILPSCKSIIRSIIIASCDSACHCAVHLSPILPAMPQHAQQAGS
jgi:hypothetical protein